MFGVSTYKMARARGRDVVEAVNVAQALSIGPHCRAFYPMQEGSGTTLTNQDLYVKGTTGTITGGTWETTPTVALRNATGGPTSHSANLNIGTFGGSSGKTMLLMGVGVIGGSHVTTTHGISVSLVGYLSNLGRGFRVGTRDTSWTGGASTKGAAFYDGTNVLMREAVSPAFVDVGTFEGSTDTSDVTHSLPITKETGPVAVALLVEGRLEGGVIPITAVTYAPNSLKPSGGEWWNERSIANGRLIYENGGINPAGVDFPLAGTTIVRSQTTSLGPSAICGLACWIFPEGYDYSDWPQAIRWMAQEWYQNRRRHWPGWVA